MSDGTYVFYNFYSGKSLRISGNTPKNGANIWQYEFNSATSGRWNLEKNPDGSYHIVTKIKANYSIDVYAGSIADGTDVWLYSKNNTNAQKFIFTETPIPSYEGTLQLRPSNGSDMCVAPVRKTDANGADIQLTEADNADVLTYNAVCQSAGYYVLVNKSNGLALTVQDAENRVRANIIQSKRVNSFAQQWLIRKNADGTYSFLSRLNSCLAMTPAVLLIHMRTGSRP